MPLSSRSAAGSWVTNPLTNTLMSARSSTPNGSARSAALHGEGDVCTPPQNPPVSVYAPPCVGAAASCWPIVPESVYTPPELVPPPPSMVNVSMVYAGPPRPTAPPETITAA